MKTKLEATPDKKPGEINSVAVLGARLTWVMFGPFALLVIAWRITSNGAGWFTRLDAFYGAVVGLMIVGRWVEHRSGAATTVTGEPATLDQYKRYIATLPIVAAAAWVAANVLGNHILS